jgi:hypothetical protein
MKVAVGLGTAGPLDSHGGEADGQALKYKRARASDRADPKTIASIKALYPGSG